MNKREVRERLSNILIEELEKGNLQWIQGLKTEKFMMQYNGHTKRLYQNTNAFFLALISYRFKYSDPRWFTFKQATKLGYKIKKGEKGSLIEFYRVYDKKTKKDVDIDWYDSLTSEELLEAWKNRLQLIYRYSIVFNAHQLDGIELFEENVGEKISPDEIVLDLCKNLKVPILFDSHNNAYYSPVLDEIHVPKPSRFKSTEILNSTILHELAHATGHEKRMNRDMTAFFGTPGYAREELRAEIASMFMSQLTRIESDETHIRNHAAYVQSWIQVIKENPDELFKIIKEAASINDYMLENLSEELKVKIENFQTGNIKETIEPSIGRINI